MGVISRYRERRVGLTGTESRATLEHMEEFFQNGENWTRGVYTAENGAKCLVAAAEHVRVTSIDDAKHWLRESINERRPGMSIEQYNDSSPSYDEVAAVIARAKQLAAEAVRTTPRIEPVKTLTGEILPPPDRDQQREVPVVVANVPSAHKAARRAARASLAFFSD
jgi:hypothetical protein